MDQAASKKAKARRKRLARKEKEKQVALKAKTFTNCQEFQKFSDSLNISTKTVQSYLRTNPQRKCSNSERTSNSTGKVCKTRLSSYATDVAALREV